MEKTLKPTGIDGICSAATAGWLAFEPEEGGDRGYGDKFQWRSFLSFFADPGGRRRVEKDGIANANELTIGGYSYGG